MIVKEGNLEFEIEEEIFYNPKMEINRDLVVTFAKTVSPESYLDGHSASGIKGIRVCKEAQIPVTAVDLSIKACENIHKNSIKNGCEIEILPGDIRKILMDFNYGMVELDPFGSPAPYIPTTAQSFSWRRDGYLSVTATDTAVLCGAEPSACMRTYRATPMQGETVHDIGLRILIKFIQEEFAQYNLAVKPLISISHRHYLKTFLKIYKNAKDTTKNLKSVGYFNYCKSCGYRSYGNCKRAVDKCPHCGNKLSVVGPIWTGPIHDTDTVKSMIENLDKKYPNYDEEKKLLERIFEESEFEGFVYDIHKIYKGKPSIPKTKDVVEYLQSQGYNAVITHYSNTIIKTDAPFDLIKIYGE